MKALLYKEFKLNRGMWIGAAIVPAIVVGRAIHDGFYLFIPLLLIYLAALINADALAIDARCDFRQFVISPPISAKRYVWSRFAGKITIQYRNLFSLWLSSNPRRYDPYKV